MQNQTLQAIAARYSCRKYRADKLTDEQMNLLVNAALQSPTARNEQAWHFTAVTDTALLKDISDEVAVVSGWYDVGYVFHDAPFVVFISTDVAHDFAGVDAGIAVENIAVAAQSLGLGSVILGLPRFAFGGLREAEFETRLKFPEGYKFAVAIAVGVPDGAGEPHEIKPGKVSYVG